MPGLNDETLGAETQDAASPPASTRDVTPPSPPPSDPSPTAEATTSAPSQDAQDADAGPRSLDEAIARALDAKPTEDAEAGPQDTAEDPGPAAEKPNENTPEAASADDKSDAQETPEADIELTDAEMAGLGSKANRRMRQLLNQRRLAREEVAALRPDAENFRAVRGFMSQHQLVDEEVAELLHLGADLKSGDPQRLQRFVDAVMPRLQMAMEATGRTVAPDLRPAIDTGEMTEEAARDLTRARRGEELANQRAETLARQNAQRGQQANAHAIQTAVDGWVNQQRTTDPDFGRKEDAMRRVVQALVQERGFPATAADAVKYAQDALAEVNRMAAGFAPAGPRPTQPTPGAQVPSSPRNTVAAPPKTLAEAIDRAMRRG